jgi:NAD(P)-dependent dehydrogenase (short-subunit alcohol dehydrogenase family)
LFLAHGWTVGLVARRAEALEPVAAGSAAAVVLAADVTREEEVARVFYTFAEAGGRFAVLFNNAGKFGPQATIDEVDVEGWDDVVAVNLRGMFLCARAAFARMRRQTPQGGRIINNGSLSAYSPRPGSVVYTTTKHAITGMTRSLSLDGRAFGIACGQIDIGNARTELVDSLNARVLAENPEAELVPMMDVADVAHSVLHMASRWRRRCPTSAGGRSGAEHPERSRGAPAGANGQDKREQPVEQRLLVCQGVEEPLQSDLLHEDLGPVRGENPSLAREEDADVVVSLHEVRRQLHRGREQRLVCDLDDALAHLVEARILADADECGGKFGRIEHVCGSAD